MIRYEADHPTFFSGTGANINFIPHMHKEIEMFYITKGSMEITLQHTTYTLYESDFLLIMPHILHSFYTPVHCEYTVLIFKSDLISHYQPLMKKYCTTPLVCSTNVHPDVPSYLSSLLLEETKAETGLLKGYLYLLFTRLLPYWHFIKKEGWDQQELLYDCLEYIDLHFKEPLMLSDLATELGVTATYISRLWNKSIGYSFSHYLNLLRIDYAKYLLRESTLTITAIGFECGYETLRHFNRVFKAFTGYSPQHYRHTCLEEKEEQS